MTEKLLKLTMIISQQMVESGAEINRVEDCISRIGTAYGASRVDVFATTSNIIVSFEGEDGRVLTQTRRIKQTATNIEQLDRLNALVRKMTEQKPSEDEIESVLNDIIKKTPSYSTLTVIFFYGIVAAAFSLLFDARTVEEFAISLLTGFTVGIASMGMERLHVNKILHRFLCSFWAAICAYGAMRIGIIADVDKVMIANIMTLISGIGLTNALRDLFTGDSISGVLKFIESVILALAIAFGYILAAFLFGGAI